MPSIASDASSQYCPLPIGSCIDEPDKNLFAKNHKIAWYLCRGHSWKQGRRSHSVGIRLGSVSHILAIRVQVHSQISCLTPHSVRRCSMVFRLRNEYSCPCPSVGFCATPNLWVLCNESPCTRLTWLYQAILRCGDCPTQVTSQWLAQAAQCQPFVVSSPQYTKFARCTTPVV